MLNRLHGQPESYDKKAKYRFGRTLGAGTYGIVREAEGPMGRVAIKIILKKNVRGNEQMVLDELDMLQRLKHPHIVKFVDWFESRVRLVAEGDSKQLLDADHVSLCLGQVLHRHPARNRRRAV
jgi:serine/threonine protein kinase